MLSFNDIFEALYGGMCFNEQTKMEARDEITNMSDDTWQEWVCFRNRAIKGICHCDDCK